MSKELFNEGRIGHYSFIESMGGWVIRRHWSDGVITVLVVLQHSNRMDAEKVCSTIASAYNAGRREKAVEINEALNPET